MSISRMLLMAVFGAMLISGLLAFLLFIGLMAYHKFKEIPSKIKKFK